MKSIGGSLVPENYRELRARFAVIVGREPTEAEISELMTDKDELGIGYGDPLLLQMMMFKRERIALAELFERQLALIGAGLSDQKAKLPGHSLQGGQRLFLYSGVPCPTVITGHTHSIN